MALQLTIVTPEGEAFSKAVDQVVLPGTEGQFGVLENHERYLTPLDVGPMEIRTAQGTEYAAIAGGFADVGGEQVVVMVESCELASDIDMARAERARDRATSELDKFGSEDHENHQYKLEAAALERAMVRINVGGRR